MVEAKIRVEVTSSRELDNPFYGNTLVKDVYEQTLLHDKDEREDIAPCGIMASIVKRIEYEWPSCEKYKSIEVFDIKINKYYLDRESSDGYLAFFHIGERVFEVFVKFNGKKIETLTLSEWLNNGDFEDGEDADNIYSNESIITCETLE